MQVIFKVDEKETFEFKVENHEFLKMLANSHPYLNKIVKGALCKKFLEELSLFVGKKINLEEANARCKRIR